MSAVELRGLCLDCALSLTAAAPREPVCPPMPHRREWFYDEGGRLRSLNPAEWDEDELADQYRAAMRDHRSQAGAWAKEHAAWRADCEALILGWARCNECPTFTPASFHERRKYSVPLRLHLCAECAQSAREQADNKYPHLLPRLTAELRMDEGAFWVMHQADELILEAWEATLRNWPRCENCTAGAVVNQRPAETVGAAQGVLEALMVHGPLTSGDLVATVKGLTKNKVSRVMSALVDEGRVEVTLRGPAKFYALPKAD